MNENNEIMKQKSSKGLIILVIILSIVVIGLVGYIVYEKISDEDFDRKITENVKKDNNIEFENDDNDDEDDSDDDDKYKIEIFTQKTASYKLPDGNEFLVSQAKGNDINSGFVIDYKNAGSMIDVEEYNNLESVGIIENNDNILIIELMSNDKNEKKVFYEKLLKSKLTDANVSDDSKAGYIINSGTKLNTNYEIDKIGKVQINNINYPVVVSNDDYYIILEDGTLHDID